jgi:predicted dehydrogenase
MKVAIIGTGLQARRRAPVLAHSKEDVLSVVVSSDARRAQAFAKPFGCEWSGDWRSVVTRGEIDAVIICTAPDSHTDIAIAALRAGKHVLCEKPLSRTLPEAEAMLAAARESNHVLKCGFNHRHHPAVLQAKALAEQGKFGRLLTGRCRYGLCGRPGYEKEWRSDPAKAAGGHLMELGIHGIDLFRWFFGEIAQVSAMTGALYFPMAPLDDNGMAMMRTKDGALLQLHSSLTQWKNLFSFEVIGAEGYFTVEGLGASYGTERLIVGRRDFEAPFEDVITEYRGGDKSWQLEWEEFTAAIREQREPLGSGRDGLESLRIVFAAYASERAGCVLGPEGTGAS